MFLISYLSGKSHKMVFLGSFQNYSFKQEDAERSVKSVQPQIMGLC